MKKRGDIRSRKQWLDDLEDFTALVKSRHKGVPIYWYGESLGALIAIHTAARKVPAIAPAGIILSSPVVALRPGLELTFLKNFAFRAALNFLPGQKISLESLGDSEIHVTSHTTHRGQMQHTSHFVPAFSVRLFAEIEQLIKRTPAVSAQLQIPILVLYTPHDPLVSREAVEYFFDLIAAPGKTKTLFPESYHLILHDKERDRAVKTVHDWLERRRSKRS